MQAILANSPNISDAELLFDADETKAIMCFFWPQSSAAINASVVNNEMRRMSQSMLITAIDASYAFGLVDMVRSTFLKTKPITDLKKLASAIKKLANKYVKYWWKHATEKDLLKVKIYESVRLTVANDYRTFLDEVISGTAMNSRRLPRQFYVMKSPRDQRVHG